MVLPKKKIQYLKNMILSSRLSSLSKQVFFGFFVFLQRLWALKAADLICIHAISHFLNGVSSFQMLCVAHETQTQREFLCSWRQSQNNSRGRFLKRHLVYNLEAFEKENLSFFCCGVKKKSHTHTHTQTQKIKQTKTGPVWCKMCWSTTSLLCWISFPDILKDKKLLSPTENTAP